MLTIEHALYYLVIIIVLVFVIVFVLYAIYQNGKMDISRISLYKKEVLLSKYATAKTRKEFSAEGKSAYTKKGAMRVDFRKAINKNYQELCNDVLAGNDFSTSFYRFIKKKYPDLRRKDLMQAIDMYFVYKNRLKLKAFDQLVNSQKPVTPESFFELRQNNKGDMVGVYVIQNITKDMYYVGQAKRLFFRVNQHFTGHGNGDVYADYKYGDSFLIWLVPLTGSGYTDIDNLEKDLIERYDAYENGYNRTSGNR